LRGGGELLRGADVVAEDILRRGNASDDRQVIHQRAKELGLRGPLFYTKREIGIAAGGLSEELATEETANKNRAHMGARVTGLTLGGARETIIFVS